MDRIVFAHDRSLDFVAVASSLPDGSARDRWTEILRGHVLVSHACRPPVSMWYWTDGLEAALLWRMAAPGDGRADRCHALVGSAHTLDTATALALYDWPGWSGDEWAGSDLVPVEESALPAGDPGRSADRDLLAIVRAFLLNPDRPVSIVTDVLDGTAKVRLLQDVVTVVGTLFGPGPGWTFSTFETRHDESVRRLPRIVFLPRDHEESRSHAVARTVVELPPATILANDFYRSMAQQLVGRCRTGGVGHLSQWLGGLGVLDAGGPRERVDRLRDALGSVTPQRVRPPVPVEVPPPTDVELLKQLGTVPRGALGEVLAEIAHRGVADDAERDAVLRLVLANSSWVERIPASMVPDRPDETVDTLVRFAISPRDWRDAHVIAEVDAAIANPTTLPRLERALIRAAMARDAWRSLSLGLAVRRLTEQGFDVSYPDGQVEPVSRRPSIKDRVRGWLAGRARPRPWMWIALVAVVFAVLIFLIS